MKLAFIGGGVMGEAIIAGALAKDVTRPQDIAVCEILPARRDRLRDVYGVRTTERAAEAALGADIVILAVKPQEFDTAAQALAGHLKSGQTAMSIMAGITLAAIGDILQHPALVRAIPNTPAQIGQGVTIWTATAAVSDADRQAVGSVLSSIGLEIYVTDEKYVDMATAVSSSGPAYVFLTMEALTDAAVHIGLRREMAEAMVIQTVLGSAQYAKGSGRHPAELRNQVTSPGGTTTEGLLALERAGLRATFSEAVKAAYEKAKQLGG